MSVMVGLLLLAMDVGCSALRDNGAVSARAVRGGEPWAGAMGADLAGVGVKRKRVLFCKKEPKNFHS
jgi:hypothetical protein